MKYITKLFLISFICLAGCISKNQMTNYDVSGLDLTVGSFGLRLGHTKYSSANVGDNASYSIHNNESDKSVSSVMLFSSNSQINSSDISNILTSPEVPVVIKNKFTENYIQNQNAPTLPSITSKTPSSATALSDDSKIHNKIKVSEPTTFVDSAASSIKSIIINYVGESIINSKTGYSIMVVVKILVVIIVLLFVFDVLRKIFNFLKKPFTKKD